MVKVAIDEKRKKIYLDECFYNTGQSTADLRQAVISSKEKPEDLVVADCADPRMIKELKGLNVHAVTKDGSVSEWLKILLDYEIISTENSYNLMKERDNYIWSDKKAGIPIDAFNHLIDAWRYYFMFQKQKINTNVWA